MAARSPKGVQTKTDNITIRANPKNRFGLELLSRKQHRNISSMLDMAIANMLNDPDSGVSEVLNDVWEPYEADRIVKLAFYCPELLSFEEQLYWKTIKNVKQLWVDGAHEQISTRLVAKDWQFFEKNLWWWALRKYWDQIKMRGLDPSAVNLLEYNLQAESDEIEFAFKNTER